MGVRVEGRTSETSHKEWYHTFVRAEIGRVVYCTWSNHLHAGTAWATVRNAFDCPTLFVIGYSKLPSQRRCL